MVRVKRNAAIAVELETYQQMQKESSRQNSHVLIEQMMGSGSSLGACPWQLEDCGHPQCMFMIPGRWQPSLIYLIGSSAILLSPTNVFLCTVGQGSTVFAKALWTTKEAGVG